MIKITKAVPQAEISTIIKQHSGKTTPEAQKEMSSLEVMDDLIQQIYEGLDEESTTLTNILVTQLITTPQTEKVTKPKRTTTKPPTEKITKTKRTTAKLQTKSATIKTYEIPQTEATPTETDEIIDRSDIGAPTTSVLKKITSLASKLFNVRWF